MAKEYIERETLPEFNREVVEVVRCKNCHLSCYVQGAIGEALFCTYWNKDTDEEGYCHEGG